MSAARLDDMFGWVMFRRDAGNLAERLAGHPGSALVSTAELTTEQIDCARQFKRLIVDPEGKGYALMFHWKARP